MDNRIKELETQTTHLMNKIAHWLDTMDNLLKMKAPRVILENQVDLIDRNMSKLFINISILSATYNVHIGDNVKEIFDSFCKRASQYPHSELEFLSLYIDEESKQNGKQTLLAHLNKMVLVEALSIVNA